MAEINSIANGSFVLGNTNELTFSAGNGIKIDQPSEGVVRIGNEIETKLEEPTFAGWYDNHYPIYQAAYTATFTLNTSYQMPNIISKTDKPWLSADRMWIDPSNSYINYGSTAVRLPSTWMLGENRLGSISIVNGGDITHRGRDTVTTTCTARVNVKWVNFGSNA